MTECKYIKLCDTLKDIANELRDMTVEIIDETKRKMEDAPDLNHPDSYKEYLAENMVARLNNLKGAIDKKP